MRMRWLAVVVVLIVMGSALLRSHPSSAATFRDVAARTQAGAASAPLSADGDDATRSAPRSAVLGHDAAHDAAALSAPRRDRDAPVAGAAHAADASWADAAAQGPSSGPLARHGTSAATDGVSGTHSAAMAPGVAGAPAAAGTALAAGMSTSALQARPTIVKSTAGTATINNAQIEVGFVFDPADNANHRLQFNGPDVAKSEFTLHGDAVSDATIDGQPAVAGQWYALHAGLTLTAVSPVAVHVRPAPPKTDG